MYSFQATGVWNPARVSWIVATARSQSPYTPVCDILTLDQPNTAELRETCQELDAVVSNESAAGQVNVADAVTVAHKLFQSIVRDLAASSKVDIVQVLAQLAYSVNRLIGDFRALGQDQDAKTRGNADNFLHGIVC